MTTPDPQGRAALAEALDRLPDAVFPVYGTSSTDAAAAVLGTDMAFVPLATAGPHRHKCMDCGAWLIDGTEEAERTIAALRAALVDASKHECWDGDNFIDRPFTHLAVLDAAQEAK